MLSDSKLLFPDLNTFDGRQRVLLVGCLSVFSTTLDRRMYMNLDGQLDVDDVTSEEKARMKASRVALWEVLRVLAEMGYARADCFSTMDGVPTRLRLPVYTMVHFARCFYNFAAELESESPETRLAHVIPSVQLKIYLVEDFVNFAGEDYRQTFEEGISKGDHDDFIFSDYEWVPAPGHADKDFIAEQLQVAPKPIRQEPRSVTFEETITRLSLRFEGLEVSGAKRKGTNKRKEIDGEAEISKKRRCAYF